MPRAHACVFGLLASLLGLASCARPTAPDSPSYLLSTTYELACAWSPATPPVSRAVFDLQVPGDDTKRASIEAVMQISRTGARVDYHFNGPMIRAEIDVAVLTSLWQAKVVTMARSVSNFSNHDVVVIATYGRPVTADDQQTIVNLGGTVDRVLSHALNGIILTIDDAKAPSIAVLPGVARLEYDTGGCGLDTAQRLAGR